MQVVVDKLLTTYTRAGNAKYKKLLIFYGWGDSPVNWTYMQTELARHFDVTVVDLPGFGGTAPPPTAWGLTEYAAFVAAFLKKTGIKPYAIIGHSNGGAIAVRGLSQGVLTAERLVLLASAGIRFQLSRRRQVLRIFTKAGKVVTYPLPANVRKRLRRRLYTAIGSDLLVAEHLQDTFKRIVTDDIQSDAATLTLPTLLVYGEDDLDTPVQYGRILHNLIAGSTLEVIGQGGHFIYLDKPAEVRDMLRKFLA